jgi:ribonuclease Z
MNIMLSRKNLLRDEKLRAFILGSGGPMNNTQRVASSIAIIAGGQLVLFDIGPGSYRNLDLLRLPSENLTAVFLTHFHSDHIGDLGEANMLSWVAGRKQPLEVYGPEGVQKVVKGFETAYELDTGYRIAHHGEEVLILENGKMISKPIVLEKSDERILCYDRNGLKIYAFEVAHPPIAPAFGYRIEYKGNIVIVTGDTLKTDNLIKHCEDADILFSEAISFTMINNLMVGAKKQNNERFAKILKDIQDYHMEPAMAAELAKEANVKKLIIVHITPPLTNEKVESLYLKGVNEIFQGEIEIGKDQMSFTLAPK